MSDADKFMDTGIASGIGGKRVAEADIDKRCRKCGHQ